MKNKIIEYNKTMNVYYIKDYIISGGVVLEKKKEQSSLSDSFSNKLCSLQKDYVQGLLHKKDYVNIKKKIIHEFVTSPIKPKKIFKTHPYNQEKIKIKIHTIAEEKGFLPIQLLPPLSPIKEQKLTQPIKLTKPVQTINKKKLNYMLKRILN